MALVERHKATSLIIIEMRDKLGSLLVDIIFENSKIEQFQKRRYELNL